MKTEFFLEQNFYKGPLRFNKSQVINRKKKGKSYFFSHYQRQYEKRKKN